MAEFIKIGNEITVKPKLEGISYELINNKVYDLEYDRMQGRSYLKENGDLNMPKKLYELEEDNKFIKRVLNYFNSENSGKTTGILLAGTKGTGKTMLSKRLIQDYSEELRAEIPVKEDEVEWDTSGNFVTDTNIMEEDFIVDSNVFEETKTAA